MRLNQVIDRFALVSGLCGEELSRWTPLCVDAMNQVSKMLRPNMTPSEADSLRLSAFAGVLAYYKYTLYSRGGIKAFTAGSLSITEEDDKSRRAKLLWEAERESVADLIAPEGFFFGRVRV
ncbi:MAG: hypothetical protein IJV88_02040 [Ruminococcus sp.]|nr:hypothetical protein [Ruminococcus sp.]